jgi:hypothetical protein
MSTSKGASTPHPHTDTHSMDTYHHQERTVAKNNHLLFTAASCCLHKTSVMADARKDLTNLHTRTEPRYQKHTLSTCADDSPSSHG